ncbi:DEAD/DEAH box helicase [Nocardioides sp.]|uniref:DEAD/DEAH box helicase n=1 Tax=Nocardioides sp. TaxID=35761 RepID=UPI0025FAA287|nr:DEAD/DEAH box helicase [Nocardioides sp.]
MGVTLAEARRVILSGDLGHTNAFDVLAALGRQTAFDDSNLARDLLIRVLDQRESVPPSLQGLLQGLVRQHGLFPYLRDVLELPTADRLAYEAHRPDGALGRNIVFHSEQAMVYERLLAGENVVLSAPTSFGKSLVVDAFLDAADITNAAVIVPTIALMDEVRRRLSRLKTDYKIITHGSQSFGDRNLIVMTQERLLELRDMPRLDFFVIDEFYKLDPAHSDERSSQLNIALDLLLRSDAQFYLLGPNITALEAVSGQKLRATFVSTGFTTVATDVERINVKAAQLPDALAQVCRDIGPGTLIYCRSPKRLRDVAEWLLDRDISGGEDLDDAADWVGDTYHPDWIVAKALRAGIGIHHGRLPRALGHHIVRLFNEGRLPFLLVTSTLIEGVNTSARNVVVLDHTIAMRKYDYFTFSNIRGRSGRMFRHFVGRVVVFNPEPRPADLNVDIPVLSQSSQVTDEVLLQLPVEELTPASRERIAPYLDQTLVSVETLKAQRGVAPSRQLEAAQAIAAEPERWYSAMNWSSAYPTTPQMRELGELLIRLTGTSGTVRSAAQLGARVNMLRFQDGDVAALARQDIERRGTNVNEAIEDALDFARNWAQFKIPTALTAASALATDVLADSGRIPTNPGVFAGELENLFQPPFTAVLEEYGLPSATTLKLRRTLGLDTAQNLDDVLDRLRNLGDAPRRLTPFELEMLKDTQDTL